MNPTDKNKGLNEYVNELNYMTAYHPKYASPYKEEENRLDRIIQQMFIKAQKYAEESLQA